MIQPACVYILDAKSMLIETKRPGKRDNINFVGPDWFYFQESGNVIWRPQDKQICWLKFVILHKVILGDFRDPSLE